MDCDLYTVMEDWEYEKVAKHRKRWIAEMVSLEFYYLRFHLLRRHRVQATGIAAIHSAGIIHRDIKPENILIDFANTVRITDFGCSYVGRPTGKPLKPTVTYCSEIIGTLPYHAPEMVANEGRLRRNRTKYGIGIDYWGLGCVAYELETCGEIREGEEAVEVSTGARELFTF